VSGNEAWRRLALVAAAVLVPATARAFPWSTDMFRGPAVQPFELTPRVTPAGALPVRGGEPRMSREDAERALRNPLAATPEHLARGRDLFLITCATCHGPDGKGDGPTAHRTIIPPANLTEGQPAQRTDGYLYATIRDGGIVMPAYGDAVSPLERWEIVLHLRALQQQVGRR
jgi:mono/diheme cytochrome c family protein